MTGLFPFVKTRNVDSCITKPTVMKFGGTSVEDARAFERVAGVIAGRAAEPLIVVVSAMSGMTDALLDSVEIARTASAQEAAASIENQFARHAAVAGELLGDAAAGAFREEIARARRRIAGLLDEAGAKAQPVGLLRDRVAAHGEELSATLLTAVLAERGINAQYVDSTRCIATDDNYGSAAPLWDETERRARSALEPLVERGWIPVVGGFVGATMSGETTTLGRGGSDYSAALIGAALSAREIEIWTDVPGVLTADPRVVRTAYTIPRLSYQEAAELAYFGAKVLHPKTIQPAVERGIPVRVCNSRAPDHAGTVIYSDTEVVPRTVKAIAHKTGITTIQITSARMLGSYGFLRALFEVFDRHRTAVDVIATSEVSVSLSLDDDTTLQEIIHDLRGLGIVEVEPGRAIISVIGEGLRNTPGIAARVFSTISDINISLISLGASSVNLTFVVDETRVREAVTRLHAEYFESGDPAGAAEPDLAFRSAY